MVNTPEGVARSTLCHAGESEGQSSQEKTDHTFGLEMSLREEEDELSKNVHGKSGRRRVHKEDPKKSSKMEYAFRNSREQTDGEATVEYKERTERKGKLRSVRI